jgi:tetratricopeptide (TPR) repeat protein
VTAWSGERDAAAVPNREATRSRDAAAEPEAASLGALVALQRTVGNAAVVRLLDRQAAAVEAGTARKTIAYGSSGDDVQYLQSRLNRAPEVATPLSVDGVFGTATRAAVKELQAAHPPLVVDGVVGRNTWPVVEAIPDEPADDTPIAKKLFLRGAAAYEKRDYAHAYDFFTRAYEREPRANLLFSRAQSLRRLGGRRDEAIALYEEYLASPDPSRKEDAEKALAELRGPAKTGDEETDTAAGREAFNRGAAHYEARRFGHAYDEFTKAYELSGRAGVLFSRAQSLRRLGGRREEAIALYEEYLATPDPGRKEEAEAALLELRGPAKTGDEEIDTAAAKALFEKGGREYEARRFAHAYDEFTKAYELSPRTSLLFSRAQALRKLGGRRDEAIALYEQYIDEGGSRKAEAEFWLGELQHSGAAP